MGVNGVEDKLVESESFTQSGACVICSEGDRPGFCSAQLRLMEKREREREERVGL